MSPPMTPCQEFRARGVRVDGQLFSLITTRAVQGIYGTFDAKQLEVHRTIKGSVGGFHLSP